MFISILSFSLLCIGLLVIYNSMKGFQERRELTIGDVFSKNEINEMETLYEKSSLRFSRQSFVRFEHPYALFSVKIPEEKRIEFKNLKGVLSNYLGTRDALKGLSLDEVNPVTTRALHQAEAIISEGYLDILIVAGLATPKCKGKKFEVKTKTLFQDPVLEDVHALLDDKSVTGDARAQLLQLKGDIERKLEKERVQKQQQAKAEEVERLVITGKQFHGLD